MSVRPQALRFKPAWWCRNRHIQTLWPVATKPPVPFLHSQRVELDDGDFIDLDWTRVKFGPIVLILHGLEGSSRSHYARRILAALETEGIRAVLMHFRGCSGEPNRLPRSYHSGETGDLETILNSIRQKTGETPLAVIGYSLGGNVLLKYLGEQGKAAPIQTAIAVSAPFVLSDMADHMNRGFARLYQRHLMNSLKRQYITKATMMVMPSDNGHVSKMNSFRDFDHAVTTPRLSWRSALRRRGDPAAFQSSGTGALQSAPALHLRSRVAAAPLHGFDSAQDYYERASSRAYLGRVAIPCLILHALDDPFMTCKAIPSSGELSKKIEMELYPRGGHVGFIDGGSPWRPHFWLEDRILSHLRPYLDKAEKAS